MPLTYVSDGAWGTGQGAPLNAPQHDTNVFTLAQGIEALETAFEAGTVLVDPYVTAAGNVITFYLSNDTTVNVAIDLPTFTYRGTWLPTTAYALNDIVTVAGSGVFMVLVAHVSDTTFDPEAVEEGTDGDLLYGVLLPEPDFTAVMKWVGPFAGDSSFNQYDVFSDPTYGVFIVNIPHTSAATFDPDAVDDEDAALYTKLAGPPFAPVDELADTTYEVTRADAGKYLRFTDDTTAGVEITFADDLDINTEVHIEQAGDGPLTFTETTVAIVPQRDGYDTTSPFKGAVITAKYVAVDTVKLIGPHGEELSAEMAVEIDDPKRAIPLDKLTRIVGFRLGEGAIAYMGALTFLVPNPDPLVIVRDIDGEALWEKSDPGKQGRNVAVGQDGEVAVAYRITAGSGSEPTAHQYIDLYDRDGALLWSSRVFDAGEYPIEPPDSSVHHMACDPDGNVFYVYGVFFETRFGKLNHTTGSHMFLQDDYIGETPTGTDNHGCTGICCDPDGNVILTYVGGDPGVRKRSGITGASLWTVTNIDKNYFSPRCDGKGHIFVNEQSSGVDYIKKLNGATGSTLLQSSAVGPIAQVIAIDDINNLIWTSSSVSAGAAIGFNADTLQIAANATIAGPITVYNAIDGTIYVTRATPASVSGYTFKADEQAYTEDWRVTHDIEFNSIGPFAQRFIGDVS